MKLLDGKTAIVTGGSRGIGKAIARKFAQQGANVVFTFTKATEATAAFEAELVDLGVKAKGVASDVGSMSAAQELADMVAKEFGSIDVLVNNAGITQDNLLMRMTEDQWDNVITVNLKSVFNMTKAVQRTMLKQRKGSIVNLTSVVGISGNAGQANYAASKAGIIGFTKSMAKELGSRNIRSNALAPGFVLTEMTDELPEDVKKSWMENIPLKRGANPEEIADVALFLASDMSSYVTGQVITACGGMNT
jgi:3-oxoacyl-[acyl-carrier protein] reductase